jgi:hypothetical protein
VQNQGTSMAAPVVAGAVALLLQANPAATITQLRTNLFSNTSTDALTNAPGATPNATWGHGRLDVYRAASTIFNCSPANRTTYQYDASNFTLEDATVSITTERAAVRFTPNISGKMGGAYFHTASKTALVMEVRTDSSGLPGALLGRVNVPDTAVSTFSWNYADLSNLNIPVTSGADYFVVVYRSPSSSATWGLRRERVGTPDNRSLTTADGITWTNPGFDYKIRSVVYSQQTVNLAMSNTSNISDIATNNQFIDNNCQLIAQLTPNGASAVSGAATAHVWIEPAVPQHAGKPFVARHYQINPANNGNSATGTVTLYFTQAEFDAFNADASSTLNLPANPTDMAGIANLMVVKYGGSSSDGSGLPATYSGAETIINPADNDIVWNAGASRWEVSFNVTGFSGFIIQTDLTPLPVLVESFSGYPKENAHVLNWKLTCINSEPVFEIERSSNGIDFRNIGTRTAPNGCDNTFTFKDNTPLAGYNYYRIKISDNGAAHYTRFILLQTGKMLHSALYPNTIQKGQPIQVVSAQGKGMLRINDVSGRPVYSQVLATGAQSVTLPISVSGIYFYSIQNNIGTQSGKLIVR